MKARRRHAGRVGAVLAVLLSVSAPVAAQSPLPPDILADLHRAADDIRRQGDHDRGISQRLASLGFAPAATPADTAYASHVMGAAVIDAIARRPALAGTIVATAVATVPEARDGIVATATAAFPAFAPHITASAGGTAVHAGAASLTAPGWEPAMPSLPEREPVAASALPAPAPAGNAAADDEALEMEPIGGATGAVDDPWEGFNRAIFTFNDAVDTYLLKPVATAYGWIVPEPVKQSVRNGFSNVMSPVVLANDLLQFELRDAAVTTSRLIVNSTMGIGGLFDIATGMGLPAHPADFGQTLYSYGVDSGPYLVLPILGPSTVRDGVGLGVDAFTHPFAWVLTTPASLGVTGGRVVVLREELIEPLDDLRESSLDYYSALRAAYIQDRAVKLRRGRPADSSHVDEMFDSFE